MSVHGPGSTRGEDPAGLAPRAGEHGSPRARAALDPRSLSAAAAPTVLVVSGLDPCGGAGFLADARVAALLGARPVGVITALTEQDSHGVRAATPVDPDVLGEQLTTLLSDVEVAAVKIGMLGSAAIARAIARALALTAAPVVWDPVVRPSRGAVPLFDGDVQEALAALLPHVALVTPNADEAALLTGAPVDDGEGARRAARRLRADGAPAVLVKGGHLAGAQADDWLADADGELALTGPRLPLGEPVHGTGCALSTAIACGLAAGAPLRAACAEAKAFVAARLRSPAQVGRGRASVV